MANQYISLADLKAIDNARQRLFQLSSNIESLKRDVFMGNPLPPWRVASAMGNM